MDFNMWLVRSSISYSLKTFIHNIPLWIASLIVWLLGLVIIALILFPIIFLLYMPLAPYFNLLHTHIPWYDTFFFKEILIHPVLLLSYAAELFIRITIMSLIRSGYIRMLLRLYDTGLSQARDIVEYSSFRLEYVAVNAQFALLTLIYAIVVVLGTGIFIIPGIYIASKWSLAHYIFVDRRVGIFNAFKSSWNLTAHYELPLAMMLLISLLLSINPYIWFFTLFITDLMFIHSYRTISSKN